MHARSRAGTSNNVLCVSARGLSTETYWHPGLARRQHATPPPRHQLVALRTACDCRSHPYRRSTCVKLHVRGRAGCGSDFGTAGSTETQPQEAHTVQERCAPAAMRARRPTFDCRPALTPAHARSVGSCSRPSRPSLCLGPVMESQSLAHSVVRKHKPLDAMPCHDTRMPSASWLLQVWSRSPGPQLLLRSLSTTRVALSHGGTAVTTTHCYSNV